MVEVLQDLRSLLTESGFIVQYSIIVPAWNEASFLPDTLASIVAAMADLASANASCVQGEPAGELIVVDNNSTDATGAIALEQGATVVFEPVNQIARARNAGARKAQGRYLIFTDADTLMSAELLRTALEHLEGGRVVGGGALIAPDKAVGSSAEQAMRGWNLISRRAVLAAGCFIYCRRDAFEAIGGFSTRVYAGEEIFLSRQLKRWGKRRNLVFRIIEHPPVVTSVRKLEWYTPWQLARQAMLVLVPGAVFSRTLCGTWYDSKGSRERRS